MPASGLKRSDVAKAYAAIRKWFRANVDKALRPGSDYEIGSLQLISHLPVASKLDHLEQSAVFREVLGGYLEWGFQQNDGRIKMGDYAKQGLQAAGRSFFFSTEENEKLKRSKLWPLLSPQFKR